MTQVLEALECVEVDGRQVYRCLRCERVLGPADEGYKQGAMTFELPASAGMPLELGPTEDRYVLRHHCCPGCAVLFEVEMVVAGAEPLSSVDLDFGRMTILVTGGLGVNGVWVVQRLQEDGHRVIVVDVRDDTSLLPARVAETLDLRIADVTDGAAITELVRAEGVEAIIHLAALLPERCEREPAAADRVNVGGTLAVLEAAREAGVRRVVYASSRAVYGQLLGAHAYPTYAPVGEDAPRLPVPPMRIYGASKVFCEELGCQYADLHGLEFVALRFASIIGIGKEARHGALPIQGRMIENAIEGKATVIERGGEERDDMMCVEDMARAVSLACSAPQVARAYNIGSGRTSSLGDLANAVRTVAPDAEISIGPGRDYLGCGPLYGLLDIARARADLGYEPEYDLASTVVDYVRDLRG